MTLTLGIFISLCTLVALFLGGAWKLWAHIYKIEKGIYNHTEHRLERIEEKIDKINETLETKVDKVKGELESKVDKLYEIVMRDHGNN